MNELTIKEMKESMDGIRKELEQVYFHTGLTYKKIGEQIGVSQTVIYNFLSRGKKVSVNNLYKINRFVKHYMEKMDLK